MKYLSIDLETTGLDSEKHQILTFSGILEDTANPLDYEDIPKFNIYVIREEITGSPFAINMNIDIDKLENNLLDNFSIVLEKILYNYAIVPDNFKFTYEYNGFIEQLVILSIFYQALNVFFILLNFYL